MIFSCDRARINEAVAVVSRAAAAKSSLAALEGILIETTRDSVRFTAYDLDIAVIFSIPAQIEAEGNIVLPAKLFGDIIRRLPEAVPQKKDGGVARLYRLPEALGNIGLISPLSDHFCASCNRIRLTADGKLKPCLHSGDEFSIKGLDRDGMLAEFERAILAKPSCHIELSHASRSQAGRNMNQIGG